jgi:hypothetical protein
VGGAASGDWRVLAAVVGIAPVRRAPVVVVTFGVRVARLRLQNP